MSLQIEAVVLYVLYIMHIIICYMIIMFRYVYIYIYTILYNLYLFFLIYSIACIAYFYIERITLTLPPLPAMTSLKRFPGFSGRAGEEVRDDYGFIFF